MRLVSAALGGLVHFLAGCLPCGIQVIHGGVDAGETSAQAIAREIQEEIGAAVADLQLLGVLESIFTVAGRAGHEIVFVYDGRFVDETFYTRTTITVTEDNGETMPATWRALDWFDDQRRLVPESLLALLTAK